MLHDVRFREISTQQGLSQSSVFCITQDKKGFIWIGTRDGLNRYDGYEFITYKYDSKDTTSLSNNEITTILVDDNNDLWVGTRGGGINHFEYKTNRFNRYAELNFENSVRSILRSSDDILWVGTSEGLLRFTFTETDQRYVYENVTRGAAFYTSDMQLIPRNKSIYSVVVVKELSEDVLLIGTEAGIMKYTISLNQFQRVDVGEANANVVTSLLIEDNGSLWIGSYFGLFNAIPVNGSDDYRVIPYNTRQPPDRYISSDRVESVVKDPFGNVWAGTRGGGLVKVSGDGTLISYLNDPSDINSLGDNIVNSLHIDNTGVLWIGTESQGCNSLDLNNKKFIHFRSIPNDENSLGSNLITSITSAEENVVWVGSAVAGIDKISLRGDGTYKIKHHRQIPVVNAITSEVISLFQDRQKTLWIGTNTNSLTRYDEHTGFVSYPTTGFVFSIYQDNSGRLWFGTWGSGLGWIDKQTGAITMHSSNPGNDRSLSTDKILAFFEDNAGNLWIGTKGGGLNVIPSGMLYQENPEFISFRHDSRSQLSLSHNDIFCITQDHNGNIWIGTGAGLNKVVWPESQTITESILKQQLKFEIYSESDGLPNSVIYGIVEDIRGRLWISTNNGLSLFDPDSETFKNYDVNDGIQANEFHFNAYMGDPNGRMYFGGVNGLTIFHPDNIEDNPFKSNILITGLKIFNKNIMPGKKVNGRVVLDDDITRTRKLQLTYKEKEITLEFSSMHYANPQRVQYKYRLLGFNDNWQKVQDNTRSVTYTNLNDGNYTFQVKATNNDGLWNDVPVELEIIILPPFWRHPLAYIIYSFLIVSLLLTFRKYSLIAVKEKNRLLIERIEHRKMTEISETKMRFFTNISHELRTPLTLINEPLDYVLEKGKIDDESKNHLEIMSKNVKRLLNLVNQLLHFRKIDLGYVKPNMKKVHVYPFVKDVLDHFEQHAGKRKIKLNLVCDENETLYGMFDPEMIATVLYNLLSNAFRYSLEGGEIIINIHKEHKRFSKKYLELNKLRFKQGKEQWIVFEIIDNGVGIPVKELKKIFFRFYQVAKEGKSFYPGSGIGLSLVKEYVELHKGYIKVKSKVDQGAKFIVYLPDKLDYSEKKRLDDDVVVSADKSKFEKLYNEPISGGEIVSKKISVTESNNDNESQGKNPVVLLVEDDKELTQYLVNRFESIFKTVVAHNGKDGYELAKENEPDIVVSDIMMPDSDGLELCKSLKNNIETSHIPVILLTSKATDDNKVEGYESGADYYFTKPFNIDVLIAQIKSLLESRKIMRDKFSKQIFLNPSNISISSTDEKFLKQVMELAEKYMLDPEFDVPKWVELINMSHSVLFRKIKALTGLTLIDFIKNFRLRKAEIILKKEKLPVSEVCYMVGFSDPKYFSKCFIKEFGKTPSQYSAEFHPFKEGQS